MSLKSNQDGVVSIIVTMLIMLLLTLIVLAISQNANREQRQAIDRQLASQAFYAAETGINDVAKYLYENPSPPVPIRNTTNCDPAASGVPNNNLTADGIVKYTCILYDKQSKTIELSKVGIADSKIVFIEPVNDLGGFVPLTDITISWDDSTLGGSARTTGCTFAGSSPALPASLPANCEVGGLRISLIKDAATRDAINRGTYTAFFLPKGTAGGSGITAYIPEPPAPNTDNQGVIASANCNSAPPPRKCSMRITAIPGLARQYLHLRSLYKEVDVTISGRIAGGIEARFANAQIMIDSTGKANDVLRRIQVRIPAQAQSTTAPFSLQTADAICKLYNVTASPDEVNTSCNTN